MVRLACAVGAVSSKFRAGRSAMAGREALLDV